MNKANLKRYAPQARKDFIAAVTQRAQMLGIAEHTGEISVEPDQVKNDVVVIGGRAWPVIVHKQREALLARMRRDGYAQTLEAVAYTWFNRMAALRFMELHDYLGHGRRVLSNPEGAGLPEILTHALELAEAGDLPGLRPEKVRELKLANQDGELFRRVLVAQCNALHRAMPFLFEAIDDETELLLPDNLLLSDSIVTKLVSEVPEEDWVEVEVIGWLYQFYISEKKEEVIGKVVKSEDIPAATQLFTPNWIVQYLVQNSVGRLWLMANPASTLATQWPYYIQPAEQTPEVQAQLDALIQTRIREDGDALNPETITVLDPACGSGHILVVAYDVLKAIYLERGYQPRAIPRLILEKNLFGLDIDDRATQLASFALLMKARADDRRTLSDAPKLNVLSLQESKGLDAREMTQHLTPFGIKVTPLQVLLEIFVHAKTLGSLIQISKLLDEGLAGLEESSANAIESGDVFAKAAAQDLMPLLMQAKIMAMKFDAVVANPPYMGSNYINVKLKTFLKQNYKGFERDLFAASIRRYREQCTQQGFMAVVCPFNWMYTGSYAPLREDLLSRGAVNSLVKPSYTAFFESAIVSLCAFVYTPGSSDFLGDYFDLGYLGNADEQPRRFEDALRNPQSPMRFKKNWLSYKSLPGSPVAYAASEAVVNAFKSNPRLGDSCNPCEGLKTGDNNRFLRYWWEVNFIQIGFDYSDFVELKSSNKKWIPHHKGGDYRRWYGNHEYVINWRDDGSEIKGHEKSTVSNLRYQLREGVTWSYISSSYFGVRYSPPGFTFNNKGPMVFGQNPVAIAAYLSSTAAAYLMKTINPTLNFSVGNVAILPFPKRFIEENLELIERNSMECIQAAKNDFDELETSWGFSKFPLIKLPDKRYISSCRQIYCDLLAEIVARIKFLERSNNQLFAESLAMEGDVDLDIPNNHLSVNEWPLDVTGRRLVSYVIGCMMGRYSLDEPSLIYANAGNIGFDPSRYTSFPADADGIVPIMCEHWFDEDGASRVAEFIAAVWGTDTLDENLAWLAESLGAKASESPDATVRRYLADSFYKDHLQTYKKRPIYWLFSSGKHGAFEALVYLHRYHEGTLSRMRAEYVVPLTGKMQSKIESLEADIRSASSTSSRTRLSKQLEALRKQHIELLAYDEKLRHYADMRIRLDLDDGVKVNYGKFGDLLADVKAVTGGASED